MDNGFRTKGYCDVAELFDDSLHKEDVLRENKDSKTIKQLYKNRYPQKEEDLHLLESIYSEYTLLSVDSRESFAILFWCFKFFKGPKTLKDNKNKIMADLMSFIHNEMGKTSYKNEETIIYDSKTVEVYLIDSVCSYLNALKTLPQSQNLFFRGHSKTTYKLVPSVLRTKELQKNESNMFRELIISCPKEFENCKTKLDYLVKMQHYGLPTRLLDITRNPLVALYFACCHNDNFLGEIFVFTPNKKQIKYENSDTVTMLSALSVFSMKDQYSIMDAICSGKYSDNKVVNKFIYEIKTEKPCFEHRLNSTDISQSYVVLTKKDNNRIIKQDGAFIICGINIDPSCEINESLRITHNNKKVLLFVNKKSDILKELDLLSVNKSTLFPEIDSVSDYIMKKYSN